ncbi:MAG: hemolysin III family protein [Eubacteriales bacterium]|nr:hemolysin III family protein [Eubacteriales bacterium]
MKVQSIKPREPINALTHLAGAIIFGTGFIFLLINAIHTGELRYILSSIIYGVGSIGLYTASTVYHWADGSEKTLTNLKKVDHSMIYVFIAATYTPICMVTLAGRFGYTLLGIVWTMAIVGIVIKFIWINLPRWLYTSFYLILGWVAVVAVYPLSKALDITGLYLLIIGGLLYTSGAVIYALKPKRLTVWKFGFHEIFHLFILAGSMMHYIMIYGYVI